MNKKGEMDIATILSKVIIVVLFLGLLYGIYPFISYNHYNTKLCHSNFGVKYDLLDYNTENDLYDYKDVNEHHYNCCWEELSFDEEKGYYENVKCKGFFKEVKQ